MQITLPLPPTLNHTYKITCKGPYGKMYKTREAQDWQALVRYVAKPTATLHYTMPVAVYITMYLKRDRDIDGSHKLLLDALEGICYRNDKQVTRLLTDKIKDKTDPRMEVRVVRRLQSIKLHEL